MVDLRATVGGNWTSFSCLMLSAVYTERNIHSQAGMFVWLHYSIKLKYSVILFCSICISSEFILPSLASLDTMGVSKAGLHNAHLRYIYQPVA